MKQSTFSAVMANSIKNLLQGYTKGIRFVAVLMLLFTIGIGHAWAADTEEGQVFYFKPNSNWTQSNATFVMNFANSVQVSMTQIGTTGIYYAIAPGKYSWFFFERYSSDGKTWWNKTQGSNSNCYWNETHNYFEQKSNCWDGGTDGNCNWLTYTPQLTSVSLQNNGTNIISGSGTSSDPFLVYSGATIKVIASGNKAAPDPAATEYYNFKQSSTSQQDGTSKTYEFTSSLNANTSYTINVDGYTKNGTSSTNPITESLYFKTIEPSFSIRGGSKFGTTWDVKHQMEKDGTDKVVYCTIPINATNANETNDQFQFKVYDEISKKWYGLQAEGSYYYKRETGTQTLDGVEDAENIELRADTKGEYQFKVDYTNPNASPKISITFPQKPYYLSGSWDNWEGEYPIQNSPVTIHLEKGNYSFKIFHFDATSANYYGNNGEMTRDNCTGWTMSTSEGNCRMVADAAGDYEFRFDVSTKKLSVTYPTHSITWVVNRVELTGAALGGATTQVADGQKITVLPTAPNAGDYCGERFVGWTNAPISGMQAGKPVTLFKNVEDSPVITENTTFYAVFADIAE